LTKKLLAYLPIQQEKENMRNEINCSRAFAYIGGSEDSFYEFGHVHGKPSSVKSILQLEE
jgi:hypothetical protein